MDYYFVLGIAEDADDEMIRSAFRALARRYHPDVGAGSSLVEFQRAREAYETLVDPERRRRYDQLRASRHRPVVVQEVIVSRRVAEPVVDLRRFSFGVPGTFVTVTRPSFFDDELIEDFFASFDDRGLWGRRRW
ncbi:MAG TPA: DnaJ domain-containing protein [Vicinamibacterales bacterium]|jgi:curved DNA-binding protein CbpA|nr:DnaJ domain-containing protein [Vicinamibacterales bacterium]